MRESLNQIGIKYKTDKSSNFHDYLNLYEKYFLKIRDSYNNILEIGILNGDSLFIFSEFFPNSKIHAIDIEDKRNLESEKISIYQGDQSDPNLLNRFEDDYFDVILDDGSHRMNHQQISIGYLFKKLKKGGIYIIEDLHTSLYNYTETLVHGKELFGLNSDGSNSTILFLEGIGNQSGNNFFLPPEEYNYLKENIESIDIFQTSFREEISRSITSIIIKK
jgi:hypothetical protein